MARRTQPVERHEGPVLDLDLAPFSAGDRALMVGRVAAVSVSDSDFLRLIAEINRLCRVWSFERRREVEPTAKRYAAWYENLSKKAVAVMEVLSDPDFNSDVATPSEPEQSPPSVVPFDEDLVAEPRTKGAEPLDLPADPSVEASAGLPWHLRRLLDGFETRYYGRPPEARALEFAEEALLEIEPLLRALVGAAREEATRLRDEAAETSTAPTSEAAPSANEMLVRRLVPVYEELFGWQLGRSTNPLRDDRGDPTGRTGSTGPAVRFFTFVFERLAPDDRPAENTIGAWIAKFLRERNR